MSTIGAILLLVAAVLLTVVWSLCVYSFFWRRSKMDFDTGMATGCNAQLLTFLMLWFWVLAGKYVWAAIRHLLGR